MAQRNSFTTSELGVLQQSVQQLLEESPGKARIILKYRHAEAKLSIRATNDVKTAKLKTQDAGDVPRVKRLIASVLSEQYSEGTTAGVQPKSSKGKRAKKG